VTSRRSSPQPGHGGELEPVVGLVQADATARSRPANLQRLLRGHHVRRDQQQLPARSAPPNGSYWPSTRLPRYDRHAPACSPGQSSSELAGRRWHRGSLARWSAPHPGSGGGRPRRPVHHVGGQQRQPRAEPVTSRTCPSAVEASSRSSATERRGLRGLTPGRAASAGRRAGGQRPVDRQDHAARHLRLLVGGGNAGSGGTHPPYATRARSALPASQVFKAPARASCQAGVSGSRTRAGPPRSASSWGREWAGEVPLASARRSAGGRRESVTRPASVLTPVRVPVLARTKPADPLSTSAARTGRPGCRPPRPPAGPDSRGRSRSARCPKPARRPPP